MIVKKPYAFLIRNFRLIHGLLFLMLAYLAVKSVNIYDFFSAYVSNHYYVNEASLASNHVSFLMYAVTIVAILLTFVIYYILSIKDKENKIYLIIMLYCIILFAYFIFMHAIFTGLETKSMDAETQRAFRDISLIVMLPQVIFIFIVLLRTLGFNLKQFDFKRDLEELEIDVSDNEEVELTLGTDTYKIARFFRKLLRLTKYFVIENKLFVISVSCVIVFAIAISLYSKVDVFGVTYSENQDIIASALTYRVTDSYITRSSYDNTVITKGKKFVLVRIEISNKSRTDYLLERDAFRLLEDKELLIPVSSLGEKFIDLGNTFSEGKIRSGEDKEYLVVFEIDEKNEAKDFLFKIKTDNIEERYKEIIVKPNNLDSSENVTNYDKANGEVDLNGTIFKNTKLDIASVEIDCGFKEKYEYYINNQLKNGTQVIFPELNNRGESAIIKIYADLNLDESARASKYINGIGDLFERYGILQYAYLGYPQTVKMTKIKVNFMSENYAYLQIPREIINSHSVLLILKIRGPEYRLPINIDNMKPKMCNNYSD